MSTPISPALLSLLLVACAVEADPAHSSNDGSVDTGYLEPLDEDAVEVSGKALGSRALEIEPGPTCSAPEGGPTFTTTLYLEGESCVNCTGGLEQAVEGSVSCVISAEIIPGEPTIMVIDHRSEILALDETLDLLEGPGSFYTVVGATTP